MKSRDLHYQVLPRSAIHISCRDYMFELLSRCFDCVSREQFELDLEDKDFVILLLNSADELKGFSTQQVLTHLHEGAWLNVLFSGDTVIDPECWGTHELARGWCEVAAQLLREYPQRRLFWLLISKGFRTYLYLPLFFHSFLPCYTSESDSALADIASSVAAKKFGRCYEAESGLVRFPHSCGQLKSDLADIPAGRTNDPHVLYFLNRNPDYAHGDELVCLAEVSLENTLGIGRRWLKKALES